MLDYTANRARVQEIVAAVDQSVHHLPGMDAVVVVRLSVPDPGVEVRRSRSGFAEFLQPFY